jgi:hypothetical protein
VGLLDRSGEKREQTPFTPSRSSRTPPLHSLTRPFSAVRRAVHESNVRRSGAASYPARCLGSRHTRLRGRREHTKRRNRSSLGRISRSASLRNRPLFSSCHNLPPPSQGIFSTCRGTVRPKNPAASTTAKITTAIIFFIRSFRKALKLNRLPLSLRGEALGPC